MKKIKVKIIGHYNRYIIFIRNSIIKKIKKFNISAPVTKVEESEASHKTAPINSIGLPYLFIGV